MTVSTYIERTVLNLSKSRRKVLSSYNFLSQPSCRSANCYRQYTPSPWFHFLPADLDFFASWHRKGGEESCMKTTQKVQGELVISATKVGSLRRLSVKRCTQNFQSALFDPSWDTCVLSGVEAQSQSWWSHRNHSAAANMLRFRL